MSNEETALSVQRQTIGASNGRAAQVIAERERSVTVTYARNAAVSFCPC